MDFGAHKDSQVAAFFAGKTILMTGATGFIGKVRSASIKPFPAEQLRDGSFAKLSKAIDRATTHLSCVDHDVTIALSRVVLDCRRWLAVNSSFACLFVLLLQLLVEKLLRACPDIKKIYLVIRPKRGLSSKQRLEKLLAVEVVDEGFLVGQNDGIGATKLISRRT